MLTQGKEIHVVKIIIVGIPKKIGVIFKKLNSGLGVNHTVMHPKDEIEWQTV